MRVLRVRLAKIVRVVVVSPWIHRRVRKQCPSTSSPLFPSLCPFEASKLKLDRVCLTRHRSRSGIPPHFCCVMNVMSVIVMCRVGQAVLVTINSGLRSLGPWETADIGEMNRVVRLLVLGRAAGPTVETGEVVDAEDGRVDLVAVD